MATAGNNGTITPTGMVIVNSGDNRKLIFTPNDYYLIDSVYIDGVHNAQAVENKEYTFTNVTGNHTIHVTFKPNDPVAVISLKNLEIRAYPNPVSSGQTLYIEVNEILKDVTVEVYNVFGQLIGFRQLQGQLTPVDIQYAAGVYLFVLKDSDGFKKEFKVVVQCRY